MTGAPGDQVSLAVTLSTMGTLVAGTQNDLTFDGAVTFYPPREKEVNTTIAAVRACSATRDQACAADADCPPGESCRFAPACAVNPAINKEASMFGFLPSGCVPAQDCTGVRSLVFSLIDPNRPITDGSVLYTCSVDIAPTAIPGEYPLRIGNVVLAYPSPPGGPVLGATGISGKIVVSGGASP